MNIFLMIFLIFIHVLLSICLCFIILLQKPDGSISIASMKNQSSRSENVVLVNITIVLSILFFGLSVGANVWSERYKQQYEVTLIKNDNDNLL
jgi:protein translocase SecG subunit